MRGLSLNRYLVPDSRVGAAGAVSEFWLQGGFGPGQGYICPAGGAFRAIALGLLSIKGTAFYLSWLFRFDRLGKADFCR